MEDGMYLNVNKSLDRHCVDVSNVDVVSYKFKATGKFRYISLASTLAEAIRRINNDESISVMFNESV